MNLYVITMKTKSGKTLYLYIKDAERFEWTFDVDKALAYDVYSELEKFGKRYFKNFKDWNIEERYFSI